MTSPATEHDSSILPGLTRDGCAVGKPKQKDPHRDKASPFDLDASTHRSGVDQGRIASSPTAGESAPGLTAKTRFGDYEIIEELARGGMGVVYKAHQLSLSRIVALKMILAGQFACDEDVSRFYDEAKAAANLAHDAIVSIFEVGAIEGQHFYSMEFIPGESLSRRLDRGPLAPEFAAQLVRSVALGIHCAHASGFIHRDLKPGNILLDEDSEPHITDFGLARRCSSLKELTNAGQILGTPSFMPPEQAAGRYEIMGPASDVYSLGAVLYAAVTGRPPFAAATPLDTLLQVLDEEPAWPRMLNPLVPRDLEAITMKCLEKSMTSRYTTARQLAEDLDRFLLGENILARQGDAVYRARRWVRKHVIVTGVSGIAALLLILLTLGTALAYRNETRRRVAADQDREDLQQQLLVRDHAMKRQTVWLEESRRRADRLRIARILSVSAEQSRVAPDVAVLLTLEAARLAQSNDPDLSVITRQRLEHAIRSAWDAKSVRVSADSGPDSQVDDLTTLSLEELMAVGQKTAGRQLTPVEQRFLLWE